MKAATVKQTAMNSTVTVDADCADIIGYPGDLVVEFHKAATAIKFANRINLQFNIAHSDVLADM